MPDGTHGDRRVHAEDEQTEVVRYERAGKWYLEPKDPTQRRRHVTIGEAATYAARMVRYFGGTLHTGVTGGAAFDRLVKGAGEGLGGDEGRCSAGDRAPAPDVGACVVEEVEFPGIPPHAPFIDEDGPELGVDVIAAEAVTCGDDICPAGWHRFLPSLGAEALDETHVRVLWRCDPGDRPPAPFTVFPRNEAVARRR